MSRFNVIQMKKKTRKRILWKWDGSYPGNETPSPWDREELIEIAGRLVHVNYKGSRSCGNRSMKLVETFEDLISIAGRMGVSNSKIETVIRYLDPESCNMYTILRLKEDDGEDDNDEEEEEQEYEEDATKEDMEDLEKHHEWIIDDETYGDNGSFSEMRRVCGNCGKEEFRGIVTEWTSPMEAAMASDAGKLKWPKETQCLTS